MSPVYHEDLANGQKRVIEQLESDVDRLTKLVDDIRNLIELNDHKSLNEMVILTRLKKP
jgi:uncharacterized FlaG/YvyC family protein